MAPVGVPHPFLSYLTENGSFCVSDGNKNGVYSYFHLSPTYVLNRYSHTPVAQPQEYELHFLPGEPCKVNGSVYVSDGDDTHKETGCFELLIRRQPAVYIRGGGLFGRGVIGLNCFYFRWTGSCACAHVYMYVYTRCISVCVHACANVHVNTAWERKERFTSMVVSFHSIEIVLCSWS